MNQEHIKIDSHPNLVYFIDFFFILIYWLLIFGHRYVKKISPVFDSLWSLTLITQWLLLHQYLYCNKAIFSLILNVNVLLSPAHPPHQGWENQSENLITWIWEWKQYPKSNLLKTGGSSWIQKQWSDMFWKYFQVLIDHVDMGQHGIGLGTFWRFWPHHMVKRALGAVCISNMVLEHIFNLPCLRKFFKIINGLGL